MKSILIILFSIIQAVAFGQMVTMGDPGYPQSNPINCATFGVGSTNFQDPGAGGNYPPNFNDTIVFCPDLNLGTKVTLTFGINAGYTFNVDGSDFIYVYDGPSVASPLIGTHNSVTDPNGFAHQASWNNPSGCLTVVFVSNGAVEGTGWLANVQCGNPFQPFEPHMEAYINGQGPNVLNPLDTGFVNICFEDSIMFIAKPLFPNSAENNSGYGYSQDVNTNITFQWNITSGLTYPNNDTIWFFPPSRNGFLVDLKITDMFPQSERILSKIRVSILPSFAGTGPLEDTVCLGQNTILIGGVTPTDTVGIDIPEGNFNLGGSFAGLTYLPDGSGAQYQAPIQISGFPAGSTISNAQDLNQVCITMEHSYLGDLEIWLQCPTGQIVPLVNSYTAGFLPGGNSGGGTYLGHPYDDSGGGNAGIGWEYCFSSVFNTIGPMTSNLTNTVPVTAQTGPPQLSGGNSIDPTDTYAPETSFTNFSGCPVNGTWTIFVQDNLTIDDGYIFEWGLYFDGSFFPGLGGYQNYVVNEYWDNDPTIISAQNDTLLVVQPNTPGDYSYTYHITDDFGCNYDTTVSLYVRPLPLTTLDTIGCDLHLQVTNNIAPAGGTWSSTAPNISFNASNTTVNPNIITTIPGTYPVTFTANQCGYVVTKDIIFPPYPDIFNDSSFCSMTYQVANTLVYPTGGVWSASSPNVTFSPSNTTLNPLITASALGNYIITFKDNICNNVATANLTFITPPEIFPDTLACNSIMQVTNTESFSGGTWTCADTAIHFQTAGSLNPLIWTSVPGTYLVTFTDSYCNQSVSANITFPPPAYTDANDTNLCAGTNYVAYAQANPTVTSFEWSTGETGQSIQINQPGTYWVKGINICGFYIDIFVIGQKICEIEAPNVLILSSQAGNNKWFVDQAGLKDFNCRIMNRWGNTIYEYSDPTGYWDGKTQGGKIVNEGTYFYAIFATFESGEEITKQGFIEVRH